MISYNLWILCFLPKTIFQCNLNQRWKRGFLKIWILGSISKFFCLITMEFSTKIIHNSSQKLQLKIQKFQTRKNIPIYDNTPLHKLWFINCFILKIYISQIANIFTPYLLTLNRVPKKSFRNIYFKGDSIFLIRNKNEFTYKMYAK